MALLSRTGSVYGNMLPIGRVGGPLNYSNDFDGTSELLLPWQNGNLDFATYGNVTIEWWLYLDTLNNNDKNNNKFIIIF